MPNAYLRAAGIAPINVKGNRLSGDGHKFDDNTMWVEQRYRRRVVGLANSLMRKNGMTAQEAVEAAAMHFAVRVAPHASVMKRAEAMSHKLDQSLEELAHNGILRLFHQEYRRHRQEQLARGLGFMSFTNARKRFRAALIRRLCGLQSNLVDATLLAQVFDSPMLRRGLAHEAEKAALEATELKNHDFLPTS